jgi:uncharacterized protein (TIGR02646 family)
VKHCGKDPAEPECLINYRTANPSATWDDFKNDEPDCYRIIRDRLWSIQGCLCAYCEIHLERRTDAVPNEQIAHFHPKSDKTSNHNWALDWDNLWLACLGGTRYSDQRVEAREPKYGLPENRSCDEATDNEVLDGKILRPDEVPAFPRLFRYRQSPDRLNIEPDHGACKQAGIPVSRVESTITKLNLNCQRLAEARLPVHKTLQRAKRQLSKSGLDSKPALYRLAERHFRLGPKGCRQAFFTVARWGLGQVAEEYLHDSGYSG